MASIVEPESLPSSIVTDETTGTEEMIAEEEPSTSTDIEAASLDDGYLPTILKKDASPYITIFLGTNFIGILLWSTIETSFPWFIYVCCPVAVVECFIYGLSKKMYFFITVSTYCNITILLFMTYLAIGGAYPWFIFPSFTLAFFPIIHYLYLHCREKKLRYFLMHISMYTLANVQIFFAWVIHSKKTNALPWFIYPWGGWGLLLMIHYNWALMKNKNMLFIYMFLDAAGVVVITFRFTVGPIVLLCILAFLVLLLIYQLCLKKRILNRVHSKQILAAQVRRQQEFQRQQEDQQQQQEDQRLQQQNQHAYPPSADSLASPPSFPSVSQREQQPPQEHDQDNNEDQWLIASPSFSPSPSPASLFLSQTHAALHPRRRTRPRSVPLNNHSNNNQIPSQASTIFTLLPSYLLPSNYFHFQPPVPPTPLLPPSQPTFTQTTGPVPVPTAPFVTPLQMLPFEPLINPKANKDNNPSHSTSPSQYPTIQSNPPSPPMFPPTSIYSSPTSFSFPPTTSFTPFSTSTSTLSPLPPPKVNKNNKHANSAPPPESPQLQPKRKKLRQPEGALGTSTDSNNVDGDPTKNDESDSPSPSSSPNKASPTFSSPSGSDLDDLVVVEGYEDRESLEDFQM